MHFFPFGEAESALTDGHSSIKLYNMKKRTAGEVRPYLLMLLQAKFYFGLTLFDFENYIHEVIALFPKLAPLMPLYCNRLMFAMMSTLVGNLDCHHDKHHMILQHDNIAN